MQIQILFDGCRICYGITKTRCIFCGHKRPMKKDMTELEVIHVEALEAKLLYLRETFQKLKKFKMSTTGSANVDEEVRKYIGEWRV